jgi:DnaK suppressor protein
MIMAKTVPLIEPTATSTEELRAMLLGKRSAVQQQINELLAQYREHYTTTHNNSVLDLEDMSLRDSTAEQQLSLLESRNRTRVMLDTALRRLDEGEYGLCEDCGAEIGAGRLKALPFAKRCVSCQHQAEVLEKIARQEDRRDEA